MATTYDTEAQRPPARTAALAAGKSGNRKPAGKSRPGKPITAHPLFPVIVALWFGALFGLGSLAIRPGLIESAVLALHIDSIVAAAAPPLGITARILLALGMGGFGAALGAIIARRMTRPKSQPMQPRRRSTAPADGGFAAKADGFAQRSRDAHPDAPARRPISAHEELGGDDLAADFDNEADGIAARIGAPLIPGRRRPLAISDDAPRDYPDLAPLPGGTPQILDIGAFVRDDALQPEHEAPGELDLAVFAPPPLAAPPVAPVAEAQPVGTPLADDAAVTPDAALQFGFASVRLGPAQPDGRAVAYDISSDDNYAPEPAAFDPDLPRVPMGADVPVVHGARPGAIFERPITSNRLFERPADDDQPFANLVIAPVADTSAFESEDAAPFGTAAELAPEPAPEPAGEPVSARFTLPSGPAAARISSASLVALSQVELIERLALSLKHRRDLDDAAPLELVTEVAFASETLPGPFQSVAIQPAAERDVLVLPAFAPPAAPVVEAPVADFVGIPSAMRPVDFDLPETLDDLPSFLPPRHLTMVAVPAALPESEPEATAPDAEVEAGADRDDSYSSLLDLKLSPAAPRPAFVRIEEPQPLGGEIEPVVIFPGQGGFHKPAVQPDDALAAAADNMDLVMRRFDAPGSPGVPSQATTDMASPLKDPEETERALRAALSSLQRMSGAA